MLVVVPFVGFKKGLILSCVGLINTLFCIVLSYKITPIFVNFVKKRTDILNFIASFTGGAGENVGVLGQNSKIFNAICDLVSVTDINITLNGFILSLMSFVFIFAFCKVCMSVLIRFVSKIVKKLPIVGKINSILGSVLGVLKAFALIFSLCAIALTISQIPELGSTVLVQIEQSALFDLFSESSASLVEVFLNSVKM